MSDAQEILKANDGLSFAEQLGFMNDAEAVINLHAGDIAALHPRQDAFVEEVKEGIAAFKAKLGVMDKEVLDADSALGAHTTHQDAILSYLTFILGKLDTIEELGEESEETVRAARKAYGKTGNRLSLSRRSHQLRRLTQFVGANVVHGDLLKKYRVTQEQLDEAKRLLDTLPGFSASLTKELSEKEEAVREAHSAEAHAVQLFNKVVALAVDGRTSHPALFQALASATAKHRAALAAA